jgi:pimeloyl-ACP methyl ester carboxylesterase
MDGVTHRYVDVLEVRMHVAEAGEGPPVVLLHGWPQHWWTWRRVIPALATERRLICPDLRGFGWSEAPPGRYELAEFADDVLALLDER